MTRGTQRALLRRRIDDPDGAFFTDAQLDEALNLGAARLQMRISATDPAAFLTITRQNIEANVDRYPKPTGSWALQDLRMLDSDSGAYVSLGEPVDIWQLDRVALSTSADTRFGFFGRFVRLAPTPTLAVTDGLEWWVVAGVSLESGAAHDSESFPFATGLSNLVVLLAQETLLPEQTGESADAFRKLIDSEAEGIPYYYRRTLGPEVGFSVGNLEKRGTGGNVWMPGTGVPFGSSW